MALSNPTQRKKLHAPVFWERQGGLLVHPNPAAKVRLVCFAYAGGHPGAYRTWPDWLPPAVELAAVTMPGHGTRYGEPLLRRMDAIADGAAAACRTGLDRPLIFFGHSMGAITAFETAQRLVSTHAACLLGLIVSGSPGPSLLPRCDPAHHLPDGAFTERVRSYGGFSEEVLNDAALLETVLPVLRADFEACETYVRGSAPPLPCPLLAMRGTEDGFVSSADLRAWEQETANASECVDHQGGHFAPWQEHQVCTPHIIRALHRWSVPRNQRPGDPM